MIRLDLVLKITGADGKRKHRIPHRENPGSTRRRRAAPRLSRPSRSIEDGQRFGLHNLRHTLNKAEVEPKTVQGILRHAKIQTTLDLSTQEDGDETLTAQGEYLTALGAATQLVQ